MDDTSFDSPEVREAINDILKDVLSTDGWGKSHWDLVINNLREAHGIETDLMTLSRFAPGLIEMCQIGAFINAGLISIDKGKTLREIIHSLVRIAYRAQKGDEKAVNQLKALHKVAYPNNYDLPATVIKGLADSYHISPHLARAWDVRNLMIKLSYVVEPTNFERSVLDGSVRLTSSNLRNRELYAKAKKHIKRGTTLLSLSTSIYIEELDKEGVKIDPRQIRFDFEKLKEWEAINLKTDSHWLPLWNRAGEYPPARLPGIPIYSDGWKKLWRRRDKDRK